MIPVRIVWRMLWLWHFSSRGASAWLVTLCSNTNVYFTAWHVAGCVLHDTLCAYSLKSDNQVGV